MAVGGSWSAAGSDEPSMHGGSGFDPETGIYHSLLRLNEDEKIPAAPKLDTATYVLSFLARIDRPESRTSFIDALTGRRFSFEDFHRSVKSLAAGLYHVLGVRRGDVVFVLMPNSIMYPTICLAVLSVGAILTTANPLNTASEIAKQVTDSRAKIAIAAPEELHKLVPSGILAILTTKTGNKGTTTSVEELIEYHDPVDLPGKRPMQSDTAAILYSSGTTGVSKGVILTHSNLISIVTLLRWSIRVSSSTHDVFLCFIPMFHIYGLAFFVLGLLCSGITTVVMQRFDLQTMIDAIQTYKINNIAAVPPVILALVKHTEKKHELMSLRRVGSGAAPLSKELSDEFRKKLPWVEVAQGYGLTESSGGATFFPSGEEAKAHPGSCGRLIPEFLAKVVHPETGSSLPPYKEGELWLKGPSIMKGYLGNEEATQATLDPDGWLKTGDLGYIDGEGYVHIVDRIKELIKHNGYQVAPAELEAILLSHPDILDSAVIPIDDKEAGQAPMAYVVKKPGLDLTEEQVIGYVAKNVAPYKKVRKVEFITAIPKSAAGKILRKELISMSRQQQRSKL